MKTMNWVRRASMAALLCVIGCSSSSQGSGSPYGAGQSNDDGGGSVTMGSSGGNTSGSGSGGAGSGSGAAAGSSNGAGSSDLRGKRVQRRRPAVTRRRRPHHDGRGTRGRSRHRLHGRPRHADDDSVHGEGQSRSLLLPDLREPLGRETGRHQDVFAEHGDRLSPHVCVLSVERQRCRDCTPCPMGRPAVRRLHVRLAERRRRPSISPQSVGATRFPGAPDFS